eukprot:gnl/MRDRNA2_/MRDRNA2_78362_c0_seq1.p1 gnl/MRDRNA2_/MRDRNA2_78362_c0~~gnl/MRDRNA2_/MRDRNA2_78362_c0_seq1.p1  ORF type:complete len:153 (-),score=10.55 gnl/MRDRNA2_/MRDRNA2_78362_c0_seq1:425-883(-)
MLPAIHQCTHGASQRSHAGGAGQTIHQKTELPATLLMMSRPTDAKSRGHKKSNWPTVRATNWKDDTVDSDRSSLPPNLLPSRPALQTLLTLAITTPPKMISAEPDLLQGLVTSHVHDQDCSLPVEQHEIRAQLRCSSLVHAKKPTKSTTKGH